MDASKGSVEEMKIKVLLVFLILFFLISAPEINDFYEYFTSNDKICKLYYEILIDHDINGNVDHVRENVTVFLFRNGSIRVVDDKRNITTTYSRFIHFSYQFKEMNRGRISGFRTINSYSPSFESLWMDEVNSSGSLFLGLLASNFDNMYILANQAESYNSSIYINIFLTKIDGFRCFKLYNNFYILVLIFKAFLSLFLSASIIYIYDRRKFKVVGKNYFKT